MAKGKSAEVGVFEGADLSELRIEDAPEWREMKAREARIEADLREAEAEVEAGKKAWMEGTKDLEEKSLKRYLAGEITAREAGVAHLDELQEQRRKAHRRIALLRDAESERRAEERVLRQRLSRQAAEEAFPEYMEIQRRILRATADLLDAEGERRQLTSGLYVRGFHSIDTYLHQQLAEAAGVGGSSVDDFVSASALKPSFLAKLINTSEYVRRYLKLASKALGESLPGVH